MTDSYNCSNPSGMGNGFFVIAKAYYVHGDKVYYYCKQNYYLEGNPIRECDGNTGNWTGSAPSCTAEATTPTTTTTTESPQIGAWMYMSAGLGGFLALFLVLVLLTLVVRYCATLCRQIRRKTENQELIETGCCFFFCTDCENCCLPRKEIREKKKYRSAGIQSVIENSTPAPIVSVPKKVARVIDDWKPSRKPFRSNNTSTN